MHEIIKFLAMVVLIAGVLWWVVIDLMDGIIKMLETAFTTPRPRR